MPFTIGTYSTVTKAFTSYTKYQPWSYTYETTNVFFSYSSANEHAFIMTDSVLDKFAQPRNFKSRKRPYLTAFMPND